MTINKNTLVGIGAIGAGLLFAYLARKKRYTYCRANIPMAIILEKAKDELVPTS